MIGDLIGFPPSFQTDGNGCVLYSFFMCPILCNLEFSMKTRDKHLEQEVFRYKEQVSALQDRLDSVTKVSSEELNNKLLNSCFTH